MKIGYTVCVIFVSILSGLDHGSVTVGITKYLFQLILMKVNQHVLGCHRQKNQRKQKSPCQMVSNNVWVSYSIPARQRHLKQKVSFKVHIKHVKLLIFPVHPHHSENCTNDSLTSQNVTEIFCNKF